MTTSNMNNDPATSSPTPQTPPAPPPQPGAARTNNVALYLPSVLGYEKIARRAAEAVAEQMDFNLDRIEDLKTAVAEACMNAIEHGNAFERGVNVAVHMTILPDKLEVRVADVGRQTVPDELPVPGSGDMRGWGFFFIQNLVDEMEIITLPDGGNEIRMVLYLQRQPEVEGKPDGAKAPASAEKPAATAGETSAAPEVESEPPSKPEVAAPAAKPDAARSAVDQASAAAADPTAAAKAEGKAPEAAVTPAASASAADAASQSADAKPAADADASDQPTEKTLAPVQEKSSAVQPSQTKPAAVQPVKEQPHAVQPVTDKPRAIQPSAADTTKDTAADASATAPVPPEQKSSAAQGDDTSPES